MRLVLKSNKRQQRQKPSQRVISPREGAGTEAQWGEIGNGI